MVKTTPFELRILGNILNEKLRIRKTSEICTSRWKLLLKIITLRSNSFFFFIAIGENSQTKLEMQSDHITVVLCFWPKEAVPSLTVFKNHPDRMNIIALVIIHWMYKKLWRQSPEKNSKTMLNNSIIIRMGPTTQRWMLLRGQYLFDYRALLHLLATQTQDFRVISHRIAKLEETKWFNLQSCNKDGNR